MIKRLPKDNKSIKSLPLNICYAKTYSNLNGDKVFGRNIETHCEIVGYVAKELIHRMPEWLKELFFPKGSELIAALHDLGKVSPTFQEKIYRGTDNYKANSHESLNKINPDIEKNWGGHAGVSQMTADFLYLGKYIPVILGQHHGYSPQISNIATDEVLGGVEWQENRKKLVEKIKNKLEIEFPQITSELQAKVLSGLTTISDWIGSSSRFDDPALDWKPFIRQALDGAGFVKPQLKQNLSFSDIFGFKPRKVQQEFISHCNNKGVYILEAPMGIGKTEAALYSAYRAILNGKATGIYFALPTQLTSNKIHERINDFLKIILSDNSQHREAMLLHGNAWLTRTELSVEGNPGGSWFNSGKRGILAPFAVGTIDQALMAVMNVKHGFVRTFGLAGKVVILDEVHSYDAYTGTLLDKLVEILRDLQCTVIILTATLTKERRYQLTGEKPKSDRYPLITLTNSEGNIEELYVKQQKKSKVIVHCCTEIETAFSEALKRAEQGQQILWIENTVDEAQQIFRYLSAIDTPIECGLLHSRFIKTDRESNELKWVSIYGKNNDNERKKIGRIIVGTQVLEQSLDIDADFLITRFCPTDMLLQRIGRLWRHQESYRHKNAKREVYLLMPEITQAIENAEKAFGKTAKVYSPYVLCRSLQVCYQLNSINLPNDIRKLIESTYSERIESDQMRDYQSKLKQRRESLSRMALVGLSKGGQTLAEETSTRYSDQETSQVLLIRSFQHYPEKNTTAITLLNEEVIILPKQLKFYDKLQWRKIAAKLLKNCVQVADYIAPQAVSIKELDWLKNYFYLGNPDFGESLLRLALVEKSNQIRSINHGNPSAKYELNYNDRLGYQAKKIVQNKE